MAVSIAVRRSFNNTATTAIYTLSLHDALPILHSCFTTARSCEMKISARFCSRCNSASSASTWACASVSSRSEEHTSELQSQFHLVCRLLLEKKNEPYALTELVLEDVTTLQGPV